jgi:hypothetical protein
MDSTPFVEEAESASPPSNGRLAENIKCVAAPVVRTKATGATLSVRTSRNLPTCRGLGQGGAMPTAGVVSLVPVLVVRDAAVVITTGDGNGICTIWTVDQRRPRRRIRDLTPARSSTCSGADAASSSRREFPPTGPGLPSRRRLRSAGIPLWPSRPGRCM